MIQVKKFINILEDNKINFYTGVPDSILKNFSTYLEKFPLTQHVLATNEGSAISIGIGHHLSTKKIPCIYMQNSGLSNAINPLISIASEAVYSIPLFLVIGWRGSPKIADEPQHMAKGKITPQLLRLLKIKFLILRTEKDLPKIKKLIYLAKKKNKIVACLIEKNILTTDEKKIKKIKKIKNTHIFRPEFIRELLKSIPQESKIISTTGYTSRELMEIRKETSSKKGKDFYMVGGMGHSSSVAAGYALSSKKKVFCLDGDGSILMHLGALRTIGHLGSINLRHIILNNNSHESVGGQKTNAAGINFEKLSKSIGYKNYFKISKTKEIKKTLNKFIKTTGPCLLEVKIRNGSLKNLSRPKNLIHIKKNFIKTKTIYSNG